MSIETLGKGEVMTVKMTAAEKRKLKLLDELAKGDDRWVAIRAKRLRDQMRTPMEVVIKKIPGGTIMEKAAKVGISRQAFYAWTNGISRPNLVQAKRLAKMTGYTVEQIRGREVYKPPRVTAATPKRRRKPKPVAETAAV